MPAPLNRGDAVEMVDGRMGIVLERKLITQHQGALTVGQHMTPEYLVLVGTEKKTCRMTDAGLMRPVYWGQRELQDARKKNKKATLNVNHSIKLLDKIIADMNELIKKTKNSK